MMNWNGAETLRHVDVSPRDRDQMLAMIVEAAKRLEAVSSRAEPESAEEHDLRPVPGLVRRIHTNRGR